MNGPTHLSMGVVSAGIVLWSASAVGAPISLATAATGAAFAGLGSLVPDIDHPRAMIGNRLPAASLTIGVVLLFSPLVLRAASARGGMFAGVMGAALGSMDGLTKWGVLLTAIGVAMLFISAKVTKTLQHRGPTHSLLASGVATAIMLAICLAVGLSPLNGLLFGLGWLTHLMGDALTPKGLDHLLWPASDAGWGGNVALLRFALVPVLLFGLLGWFQVSQTLTPSPSVASPAGSATGVAPASANTALALERLREADPKIAAALTNPATPVVVVDGAYTSYTWEYLRKVAQNQVVVKTITVTLDASGQIVGAD